MVGSQLGCVVGWREGSENDCFEGFEEGPCVGTLDGKIEGLDDGATEDSWDSVNNLFGV